MIENQKELFPTMVNGSGFVMVKADSLLLILNEIRSMRMELNSMAVPKSLTLYCNKDIKELLGVQDKLLKKYRDDGLLSFSQVGDKFWYTQDDIDKFLKTNYYAAFGAA